ncbi:MAG: type II secretion system F family protein, partial [Nitrospinae bacterium]|nr:type II secretion system F family protein [Nitrospinota bacterium]
VVTCVAITAAFGLAVFVVPQLAETFQRSHRQLPALTRWLLFVSGSVREGWHIIMPALALLLAGGWRVLKAGKWRRRFERFILQAPLAGRVTTLGDCARFARTLATLLASGTTLVPALKTAGGAIGNSYLRDHAEALAQKVSEGESLGGAMDSDGLFPPILTSFVATGESGGKLADSLDAAADQMTVELETKISALTALLEPALVLFMGGMVLLIALAALLPMFEMSRMKF